MAATILGMRIAMGQEALSVEILEHCQNRAIPDFGRCRPNPYMVVARAKHEVLLDSSRTLPQSQVVGATSEGGALWYWLAASLRDAELLFGHLYQMNKVSCWLVGNNPQLSEPAEIRLVGHVVPRNRDGQINYEWWAKETEKLRLVAQNCLLRDPEKTKTERLLFSALLYPPGSTVLSPSGQLEYGQYLYTYTHDTCSEEVAWKQLADCIANQKMHAWLFAHHTW